MASGLLCCTQEQFVPIGFLWMACSHGAISWDLGSSWSSHPVQFHPAVAHSSLESSLGALCESRPENEMTAVRRTLTQPHAERIYCKFQSNQTCSKLPAWLSEQQVKGWNCCLSWAAMFLWPQHPLLETQETRRFRFRKLDAALPESMLPGRVSWHFGSKWLIFGKECLVPLDLKSPNSPHRAPYLSPTLYGPSPCNPAPLLPLQCAAVKDKLISLSWRHDL